MAKLHNRLARCLHGITHTDITRRYKLGPSTCVCSVNYKALSHLQAQTPPSEILIITNTPSQTKPNHMTSLQAVGKNYRLKGKEIATSLTSTTITNTTASSTISASRAYHFSRRFLECPNIILATCRHNVPPTVRSDRNFSAICLFRAQQANEYMRFPTTCYVGFSSFPNCKIYTQDNRVYYIHAVLYCLVLSVSKLQVNYSSHITPSLFLLDEKLQITECHSMAHHHRLPWQNAPCPYPYAQ